MAETAGNMLNLILLTAWSGTYELKAEGSMKLCEIAGQAARILHLPWSHLQLAHLESGRLLYMEDTLMEALVLEGEHLLLYQAAPAGDPEPQPHDLFRHDSEILTELSETLNL